MDSTTSDTEEVLSIGFGEAAKAQGNIGRNRQRGSISLVHQEFLATSKFVGLLAKDVGNIHRRLVINQLLEADRHLANAKKKVESGE